MVASTEGMLNGQGELTLDEEDDAYRIYPMEALVKCLGGGSLLDLARIMGVNPKIIRDYTERGLTHKEADRFAVRCGLMPYSVWPSWLGDNSPGALYDPTPTVRFEYCEVKWHPRGLQRAIMELANLHYGEPISPASVAREIGKKYTPGIWVQMQKLAGYGYLETCSHAPARYMLTRADVDLGPSHEMVTASSRILMRQRCAIMQQINALAATQTPANPVRQSAAQITHLMGGHEEVIYPHIERFIETGWANPLPGNILSFTVPHIVNIDIALEHYGASIDGPVPEYKPR